MQLCLIIMGAYRHREVTCYTTMYLALFQMSIHFHAAAAEHYEPWVIHHVQYKACGIQIWFCYVHMNFFTFRKLNIGFYLIDSLLTDLIHIFTVSFSGTFHMISPDTWQCSKLVNVPTLIYILWKNELCLNCGKTYVMWCQSKVTCFKSYYIHCHKLFSIGDCPLL